MFKSIVTMFALAAVTVLAAPAAEVDAATSTCFYDDLGTYDRASLRCSDDRLFVQYLSGSTWTNLEDCRGILKGQHCADSGCPECVWIGN